MTSRSLTFGRGPGADVTVEDDYCSAVHCRITERDGSHYVEDLGSTNGTWIRKAIGGDVVRVHQLRALLPGDQVRIGRTTLPWEAQ